MTNRKWHDLPEGLPDEYFDILLSRWREGFRPDPEVTKTLRAQLRALIDSTSDCGKDLPLYQRVHIYWLNRVADYLRDAECLPTKLTHISLDDPRIPQDADYLLHLRDLKQFRHAPVYSNNILQHRTKRAHAKVLLECYIGNGCKMPYPTIRELRAFTAEGCPT